MDILHNMLVSATFYLTYLLNPTPQKFYIIFLTNHTKFTLLFRVQVSFLKCQLRQSLP